VNQEMKKAGTDSNLETKNPETKKLFFLRTYLPDSSLPFLVSCFQINPLL